MECFSYKSGCGICECTRIEIFKEELGWAIDKQLWFIINTLFKTCTTKNLKNKAIFNLKQYRTYALLCALRNIL